MFKLSCLTALCCSLFFYPSNGCASGSSDVSDVQNLIHEYVEEHGAVGVAIGLIDQGEISFFTYGKKNIQQDAAITLETIFEIGSITKVFTTLALVDRAASGEINLDDPIEIYLQGVKIPERNGKKITLRHLATHTSGLPRLPDNINPGNINNPYADYTITHLYDFLEHYSLLRAPGEEYEYSNVGVGLLGHILSRQADKSYEELIQSAICKKLALSATSITLTTEMQKNLASEHHEGKPVEYWAWSALAGADLA